MVCTKEEMLHRLSGCFNGSTWAVELDEAANPLRKRDVDSPISPVILDDLRNEVAISALGGCAGNSMMTVEEMVDNAMAIADEYVKRVKER